MSKWYVSVGMSLSIDYDGIIADGAIRSGKTVSMSLSFVMWAMEKLPGKKSVMQIVSMIVGLIVCYAFGTAWFMIVYSRANGAVGLATVLGWCVIPFIIPDIIKIVLAYGLSRKLRKFVA